MMFGLGQRRQIPLTAQRAAAMLAGGLNGWAANQLLHLTLFCLVVPSAAPKGFLDAVEATVCIGVLARAVTALMGEAIDWARGWRDRPSSPAWPPWRWRPAPAWCRDKRHACGTLSTEKVFSVSAIGTRWCDLCGDFIASRAAV